MTREEILKDFFDSALKGESKTYNDHNWYVGGSLKGYIEGGYGSPYPLLKKKLSEYTIGEVMGFQSRPRDNTGQLWATGRYQIIPSTLEGIYNKAGLSKSDKYDKKNQDKLGFQLMLNRKPIKNYINGAVPDTTENLQSAALQMSMIWSSIGVPYAVNGKKKNQSYYPNDKASVDTETIQIKLRELREKLGGKINVAIDETKRYAKKNMALIIISILLIVSSVLLIIYRKRIVSLITKL